MSLRWSQLQFQVTSLLFTLTALISKPVIEVPAFQTVWRSPLFLFHQFISGLSAVSVFVSQCNFVHVCEHFSSCAGLVHHATAGQHMGHICQCHEVEPFPARAGNLFHFPRVFLAPFFFCREPMKMCNTKKCYYFFFFPRGYYWGVGGGTLIWMFVFFFLTETGVGSLHALRSRTRSVPGVGPATRHGQLLWGSYRWGFPRDLDWKLGCRFYWRAQKKKELHFEWTKYVNLFPKRIDLHILKTNAVSPLLQTQHRN